MADTLPRRSALADVAPDGPFQRPGVLTLRDLGYQPKAILKGRPTPAFLAVATAVLGVAPPLEPTTAALIPAALIPAAPIPAAPIPTAPIPTADGAAGDVLWLGPGEWLVVAATDAAAALAAAGLVAVETGDGLAGLEVSGPAARAVLAGGTALDLHPRAFAAGRATRTRLGRIGVILHQTADHRDAGAVYRLYVERSWAGYLWSWLADAALDHFPSNGLPS